MNGVTTRRHSSKSIVVEKRTTRSKSNSDLQRSPSLPVRNKYAFKDKVYITCSLCSFDTFNLSSLKRHMRIHKDKKVFTCNVCGFMTTDDDIDIHMTEHPGWKSYMCQFYDGNVPRKENRKGAKLKKLFSCESCNYKTTRKDNVKSHMKVHTSEKPFECPECDYKAFHRGHINRHMRIHTGEKPFTCKICDYCAAQSGSIEKHMNSHYCT